MNNPIYKLTAISLIFGSMSLGVNALDGYVNRYQNDIAIKKIIGLMSKECQVIKLRENLNDTFEETSVALNLLLGENPHLLLEEHYLELLSRCMVSTKKKGEI